MGVRKMVWVLVLAAVTPLLAGGAEALGQPDSEYPPPKDYAYRNGKVIIEGDVVPCRFASEYGPSGDDTSETRAQFERAIERCEQAEPGALPDTGGPGALAGGRGVAGVLGLGRYSPNLVEGALSEVRRYGVLRSWHSIRRRDCAVVPLLLKPRDTGMWRPREVRLTTLRRCA